MERFANPIAFFMFTIMCSYIDKCIANIDQLIIKPWYCLFLHNTILYIYIYSIQIYCMWVLVLLAVFDRCQHVILYVLWVGYNEGGKGNDNWLGQVCKLVLNCKIGLRIEVAFSCWYHALSIYNWAMSKKNQFYAYSNVVCTKFIITCSLYTLQNLWLMLMHYLCLIKNVWLLTLKCGLRTI